MSPASAGGSGGRPGAGGSGAGGSGAGGSGADGSSAGRSGADGRGLSGRPVGTGRPSRPGRPGRPGRPAGGATALSATSAGRFAARARARRWAGRRRLLLLGVGLACLLGLSVAAVWAVFSTSLLGVRTVRVEGLSTVPAAQAARLVAVPRGTPLARIDEGAVARRLLTLPAVADVRVDRRLPGTLVVTVTEREPAAVARGPGNTLRLVDSTGAAYRTVETRPRGLPLVQVGPATDLDTLRGAVKALAALPPAIRPQVVGVLATRGPNALELRMTQGRRVIWGDASSSGRKAAVLVPLLQKPAAVYDLSAPDAPVTSGSIDR